MKELKSWDHKAIHVQENSFRFVALSNNDYESKEQHQIDCGSFTELVKTQ